MSNSQNQANSRHHYVQKAYLDKFTETGLIDVIYRVDGSVRRRQRTENVANMKGLYTIVKDDGQKDGSLEGAFAIDIEDPAMKIINNITSLFPYVPRDKERSMLAHYVAFQYLRTLEAKRRFELETGRLAAIQIFNIANNPNKIKEYLVSIGKDASSKGVIQYRSQVLKAVKNYEITPGANSWISTIMDNVAHIAQIMLERYYWHLYAYNDVALLTCDHPVVLRRIRSDMRGIGFGNADEILFPLGNKHALILSTDPTLPEGVLMDPGRHISDMLNNLQMNASYLEIFCPPSLSNKYEGQVLGKRAIVTMTGSIPGIDFLNKYSGIQERERPNRI